MTAANSTKKKRTGTHNIPTLDPADLQISDRKIFISYKQGESSSLAHQLYEFFLAFSQQHEKEFQPFLDTERVYAGEDWWNKICQEIRGRSHFISLISKEYLESVYCLEELHFANRCHSVIIPVRVDDMLMSDIELLLKNMSSQTGYGEQPNFHIIDCPTEQFEPTKLEEILRSSINRDANNFGGRKEIPFPRCPINPVDELKRIDEKLTKGQFENVDTLISNLRTISQFGIHREATTTLLNRLKIGRAEYLSYFQHVELDRIRRSLTAIETPYEEGIVTAARKLGVAAIYANRHDAADPVKTTISSTNTKQIYLMGVSLNNFEHALGEFHESWEKIRKLVESATNDSPPLKINILLAHPYSVASVLRSKSEDLDVPVNDRRLTNEVRHTAGRLKIMQEYLKNKEITSVTLEARLYTTAPIMFMLWTENVSFLQQYYFWDAHQAATMPILRFDADTELNSRYIHDQLKHHFESIWNHASVPLSDYLAGHKHGVDTALYQAGAVNVYTSNAEARERIIYLMRNAKRRVWLQGITLYSYFGKSEELTQTLIDLVEGQVEDEYSELKVDSSDSPNPPESSVERPDPLDIRVLLIDPDSLQAQYRAYREYLISQERVGKPPKSFNEYIQEGLHRKSRLWREAYNASIEIDELKQSTENPNFKYRIFDSAPYGFLLIVDDTALIEQYHYGSKPLTRGKNRFRQTILGKDMPKIEYGSDIPDIFLPDGVSGKGAAALNKVLADHFQFAWDMAREPDKSE